MPRGTLITHVLYVPREGMNTITGQGIFCFFFSVEIGNTFGLEFETKRDNTWCTLIRNIMTICTLVLNTKAYYMYGRSGKKVV